jgi:uncharacterized protein (TIGR02677 family)
MNNDENTTSAFNLTDRVQVFSYLVSSNRTRWYRVIMRTFLQHHKELYRYQLMAQEIRDAVRAAFDPEYTLEQCQNDLLSLKEWGNVTTIYDSSRATSIASFLSPALLYQATPEAIAIETFLDEQARASAARGSLRQGDLPRLWQALQSLDALLQVLPANPPAADLAFTSAREVAEEWQRAFEGWNTMAREAAQYLANMTNAAQQAGPNLEAYQQYKAAVVAYVHGFAQALTQYSRRIREQLHAWNITGKKARLVEIVALYLDPPALTTENRRGESELAQDATNQVEAMVHWFAEGKNADSFRRNALTEVDKVVRRASVLAASARPNANYATQLDALAHHFLQARDGEVAQQLFSVAFANLLPVHLPESLAGTPSTAYDPRQPDTWQDPATVELHLRPISRGYRGNQLPLEDPIIDHRTIIREMLVEHENKLKEQFKRFARLFATGSLDIGALKTITTEDRALLTEIIDACLGHTAHQYRALDGTTILLLNPAERVYTPLRSSDGILFLPSYCLERQEQQSPEEQGAAHGPNGKVSISTGQPWRG